MTATITWTQCSSRLVDAVRQDRFARRFPLLGTRDQRRHRSNRATAPAAPICGRSATLNLDDRTDYPTYL